MSIARARSLRRSQTSAEAVLRRSLRSCGLNGWKFRRQFPVEGFVVDFACVAAWVAVELDGATHSTEAEITRDVARTETIQRCGYEVVRFTNAEVYENLDGVRGTVLAAIERTLVS